jgi:hypothetical protein
MTPEAMFTSVAWILGAALLFAVGYAIFKFFMD